VWLVIYCDSAYLVKFYIAESGSKEVRNLFETRDIASSVLAQVEVAAALHRKWREGVIGEEAFRQTILQFNLDLASGCWTWIPLDGEILEAVRQVYQSLPPDVFLRAGDAIHLVSARDNGFKTVYSNDKHMLQAARHFGLRPKNVIV
jgi:predicted nucleic acid-binding protein